jgi:drug/metabolite transporter (DMT)-like permease
MRNGNGFLIAAAGFALLTSGDAVIKSMAGQWPVPAIAALRFTLAIPLLAGVIFLNQGTSGFVVGRPWVQVGRGLTLATSSLLFFLSLFLMPLAEATAIVFVSPVITALLSALLLKEPMHRSAWLSTLLALAGVALVLRPNIAELGLAALLPLGAALCFSTMMILNRIAAGTGSPMALQWVMVCVAAPTVLVFAFAGHWSGTANMIINWPDNSVILRCAIVAVSASAAHWLIFQGTIRTTAANAAQAVYAQLLVALVLDAIVFRHYPDAMALGGAVLIVCAGLTMWLSQQKSARV